MGQTEKISADKIREWREQHWVVYASRMIPLGDRGLTQRLTLSVNLNKVYRVVSGTETLYEGGRMETAVDAFNAQL